MATDRKLHVIERLAQQSDAAIDQLLLDVFDAECYANLSVAEASQLIGILQDRLGGGPQPTGSHEVLPGKKVIQQVAAGGDLRPAGQTTPAVSSNADAACVVQCADKQCLGN